MPPSPDRTRERERLGGERPEPFYTVRYTDKEGNVFEHLDISYHQAVAVATSAFAAQNFWMPEIHAVAFIASLPSTERFDREKLEGWEVDSA